MIRSSRVAWAVLFGLLAVSAVEGQQAVQLVGTAARNAAVAARLGALARAAAPQVASNTASVIGLVGTTENQAVPDVTLRLRNVLTGRLEATTTANAKGEFAFQNLEGGTYVVEIVDRAGKVLAVGSQFSLAPGETVATFVRLVPPPALLPGFFGNAAAAAVSTAGSLGLTAVTATEPVSPPE